jgi:hypothetical protein
VGAKPRQIGVRIQKLTLESSLQSSSEQLPVISYFLHRRSMRDQQVLCTKTSELRACKHDSASYALHSRWPASEDRGVGALLGERREDMIEIARRAGTHDVESQFVLAFVHLPTDQIRNQA